MTKTYTYKQNGYDFEIISSGKGDERTAQVWAYGEYIGQLYRGMVCGKWGGKTWSAEQFNSPMNKMNMTEAAKVLLGNFCKQTGRDLWAEAYKRGDITL
jgi:hypothetical protein